MKSFFKFFAERHLLANLLTIMIVLLGVASALRINRSQFPKVDLGTMRISTYYPGASSEDVELNVTNKIEDELKSVTGIKKMNSTSMENISIVVVEIDPDFPDQEQVKREVREAVAKVSDLPTEVTESPTIEEEKSTLWPIIEVGISGEEVSYRELREYARLFEKKLKDLPGVASINKYGYRAREVRVEVSPDKMVKFNLPLREIIAAIQARNIRASGGSLESYTSEKNVVTLAQFRRPQEVGDVIIRSSLDGAMVWVKDLAVVYDDFEEERLISRIQGKVAISFEVVKSETADIIRTVDMVKSLIEEEEKQLPAGSQIEFLFTKDESNFVRNKFDIVISNGGIGLVLVLIVLSLFLNVRSSIWVALGIPFTILGVIILLPLFDVDLDSVTLSSMIIVLGIIVDDAIVIAENIFQRREKGDTPLEAAVNGLHEVYLPVLTTITTTALAFLPMFFMKGTLGKFVFVIPLTITLALFISLFESFLLLPSHLMPGLQTKATGKKRSFGRTWFRPLRDAFEKHLLWVLKLRYLLVIVAMLSLGASLWYAGRFMDFILFPSKGADKFFIAVELPIGSSLHATHDKVEEIENILRGLPEGEVASYLSRVGVRFNAADYTFTEVENTAFFAINLTPYSTRERIADDIVEDLRQQVRQLENIQHATFTIDAGGPPTGKPVEIRVVGADDTQRTKLASDMLEFLNTLEGVKDIDRSDKAGKDEVKININYERLARYGLTVADIAQNIRIAYDGEVVTSTRYGEDDVEFRVLLEKQYRQDIEYIKRLRIPNRQGELIALDEIATLDIGPGASVFHHYDGERVISVTGDVDQARTTPIEVMKKVHSHFDVKKDYPGVRIDVGGEAQESAEAMIDLLITFGIAGLGIYFLLILLFNSIMQPIMVLISIPFGLGGVIFAFAAHGEAFSFLGMLGVIGMAGVVVNDSLVLVDHLNDLIRNNKRKNVIHLVAFGTANRLRPIILTSLTTVAGLLPLAYGLGGQDIYMSPMALALGYGLLFATPLTLVFVPSLYIIGHDIKQLISGHNSSANVNR